MRIGPILFCVVFLLAVVASVWNAMRYAAANAVSFELVSFSQQADGYHLEVLEAGSGTTRTIVVSDAWLVHDSSLGPNEVVTKRYGLWQPSGYPWDLKDHCSTVVRWNPIHNSLGGLGNLPIIKIVGRELLPDGHYRFEPTRLGLYASSWKDDRAFLYEICAPWTVNIPSRRIPGARFTIFEGKVVAHAFTAKTSGTL